MTGAILPRMSALYAQDNQGNGMLLETALLKLWCRTLVLNRWLQNNGKLNLCHHKPSPDCSACNSGSKAKIFGPSLLQKTLSSQIPFVSEPYSVDVCSSVLAVLLEELETFADVERRTHIDYVIAGYLSFCNTCRSAGKTFFDFQDIHSLTAV